MRILLDLDNVAAALMERWLCDYNTIYNDSLTRDQITDWAIHKFAKNCSTEQFYAIIHQPNFFYELEPIADSIETTIRLQQAGHELVFVTATPFEAPTAGYDKCRWVEKYFPHIGQKNLIQAYNKYMVNGDLIFDDGPKNLERFQGVKVAMDFPYNLQVPVNYRVNNWLQFEEVVSRVASLNKLFGT